MSIYSAEDPEGRATDTAAWRDDEARNGEARNDETAPGARRAPSGIGGTDEAADPDVIVLEEADVVVLDDEPRDSGTYAGAAGGSSRLADGDADPDLVARAAGPSVNGTAEPGLDDAGAPAADPVSPVRDPSQDADPGSPVSSDPEAGYPAADIAADTGPELTDAGTGATTGPGQAGTGTGTGSAAGTSTGLTDSAVTAAPGSAAASPGSGPTAAAGGGPDGPGAPSVAELGARTIQLQERWLAIQSDFVDDPRRSVAAAAELVTEAIDTLVADVKERDASLRGTWDTNGADTEVLRIALQDYRSFLDRLVAL
jgi:hypothetical protein